MFGSLQGIEDSFFVILQLVVLKISPDLPHIFFISFRYLSHFYHLLRLAMLEVIGIFIDLFPHVAHLVEDEAREAAYEEDLHTLEVYPVHFSRYLHREVFFAH